MKIRDLITIKLSESKFVRLNSAGLMAIFSVQLAAQTRTPPPVPQEDYTWWYVILFVLFVALGGAVIWMMKNRKEAAQMNSGPKKNAGTEPWETGSVDADKEMEWYRQHKKSAGRVSGNSKKKSLANKLPQTGKVLKRQNAPAPEDQPTGFSEKEIKDKLQQLQFSQLPISKLRKLELARPFSPLPISNDDALMSAIEQTQDEFEEDEQVRELAVRILARFKTRNSVESLSQVALYDLSSNLRSKAVSILADFDHESVFETILLACADPTREVRAAAARGLFRLSFDRADAWTRIAETNEEFRMRQAARAATEADLVGRSLDRLIHQDQKIAYEAFTLLALMVKTDEFEELFQVMEKHRDENVKLAFLRVLEVVKEERVLPKLHALLEKPGMSKELSRRIVEVIESFELVAV